MEVRPQGANARAHQARYRQKGQGKPGETGVIDLPVRRGLLSPTLSSIGWRRGERPELEHPWRQRGRGQANGPQASALNRTLFLKFEDFPAGRGATLNLSQSEPQTAAFPQESNRSRPFQSRRRSSPLSPSRRLPQRR